MKSTGEDQSKELTLEQFSESLDQWGKSELGLSNSELNIEEAKKKILKAYQDYLSSSSYIILELHELGLNSLPDVIFEIKNLIRLDIGNNWSSNEAQYNKISIISPLIANLKKLRTLIFHRNQISKLPDKIGELTELTELRGQYNLLTSLPKTIEKLTKLKIVFLPNNQISSIPEEIKNCPIQFLSLYGNNLTDLAILRISYIDEPVSLGIEGNSGISIKPAFYRSFFLLNTPTSLIKMESAEAGTARNNYNNNFVNLIYITSILASTPNLARKKVSEIIKEAPTTESKTVSDWLIKKFIFSKEKKLNPQNLSQPESKLVENTSHFFNLLTGFYQSNYFQGLNSDQQDSISQALSKILVTIYERRDDEIFLQEVNNFAEKNFQAIADSPIKFVGAIYKIKNLCDDKDNFQSLNQSSKEDLLKHLKDQALNSYIEDLVQRKKIGTPGLSRFSDIEIYETLIREFNKKINCNISSFEEIDISAKEDKIKSFFPDLLDIELLTGYFDAKDLENLTPEEKILALQSIAIAKELFENPNSNIFGIKDHDLLNSLNDFKIFLDKISGIAISKIQDSILAIDQKNTSIALINDQKIKEFTKILFLKLKEINSSNLDLSSIINIQLLYPTIDDKEQELIKTKFRFLVSNAVKTLTDSDQKLLILKQFRDETSNIKLPKNSAINISSAPQARAFGPELESPQDISARISRQNQEIKLAEEKFNQRKENYLANKKIDDQVKKIELELDEIHKEIDEALLENSKNFLDGIVSEIETEQGEENKSQKIVSNKIKAIDVASKLTSEVIDKELSKFENNEIAGKILDDLIDEAVEASKESSVSSQLDLVETKISKNNPQIAVSKEGNEAGEGGIKNTTASSAEKTGGEVAIEETAVSGNGGSIAISGRRSSGDGLQTGDSPGSSPSRSLAEIRRSFETPDKRDDNSLRRASCCPISFGSKRVRGLIEQFNRIANRGRGN